MRLEMEYLHLRNSIIFRAPARRVHLPRRLQLLTAIDARCLYLTRTLDVKLERSAIYVIRAMDRIRRHRYTITRDSRNFELCRRYMTNQLEHDT